MPVADSVPGMLGMAEFTYIAIGLFVATTVATILARPPGLRGSPPRSLVSGTSTRPRDDEEEATGRRAVVVVQPVKYPAGSSARSQVTNVCAELGWKEPVFIETTPEDPGVGQARRAVEQDADVVLVLGGDGTLRSVAEGLAGTGVPLGLVPGGTGNLFARQLGLGLGDVRKATRAALTGRNKAVDIGRVRVDGGEEQVFLVMAGLGFDAEMMAGAPAAIKDRVGPLAYIVSGLRRLKGESTRVTITFDDGQVVVRRVRMAVVGNCGTLIGGIVLIPDAEVDDGNLDVLTLSPRGLLGWALVGVQLLTGGGGRHRRMLERQTKGVSISVDEPQEAQMDGDPIGPVRLMEMRVDPGALVIRTPDGDVPHRKDALVGTRRR